ncbi:hypothetical protein GPN2_20530 [Streptomyces murinus]
MSHGLAGLLAFSPVRQVGGAVERWSGGAVERWVGWGSARTGRRPDRRAGAVFEPVPGPTPTGEASLRSESRGTARWATRPGRYAAGPRRMA